MKKMGPCLSMRGQVANGVNGHELQLWDGSFKTGFQIEEFVIIIEAPTGAYEAVAKLHTSSTTPVVSNFDFGNNQEFAWSAYGAPNKAGQAWSLVDPDNLIIQNLYLSTYATSEVANINYYIKLQKYKLPAWRGALAMVRNVAQGIGEFVR